MFCKVLKTLLGRFNEAVLAVKLSFLFKDCNSFYFFQNGKVKTKTSLKSCTLHCYVYSVPKTASNTNILRTIFFSNFQFMDDCFSLLPLKLTIHTEY